jgi:hypothetical protein
MPWLANPANASSGNNTPDTSNTVSPADMMMSGETQVNAIMAKQPTTTANVSKASQPMYYTLVVE